MIYFYVFILGLIFGSFANVVICRLKTGEAMFLSRSCCPSCRHFLSAVELIPLLSFFRQGGRCLHCGQRISWQYPAVELAMALLFILVFWRRIDNSFFIISGQFLTGDFEFWLSVARDWLVIFVMTVIFVYDLRWYQILDKITIPAILIFFLLDVFLGSFWLNRLLAGAVGGLFFFLQWILTRGRGIGDGDIRLGALMGVILGWPLILIGLLSAYVVGAIAAMPLLLSGQKKIKSAVPFGPFLVVGFLIAMFFGQDIFNWYWGLL